MKNETYTSILWSLIVLAIMLILAVLLWVNTDKPLTPRELWELEDKQEMVVASSYEYKETK